MYMPFFMRGVMELRASVLYGLLLPLLGTSLGAAGVFFLRQPPRGRLQQGLQGFAAGIMTAASVWSLLLPALARSSHLETWSFLPAAVGILGGVGLLHILDHLLRPLEQALSEKGVTSPMLLLAVALHNLPEGMAVGAVLAGSGGGAAASVAALSMGIALQNIPEGAIISLPLRGNAMGRGKAFAVGVLSGVVEPVGALLTLLLARVVVPLLPYVLSLSAGAMLYVVTEELVPELREGNRSDVGAVCFAVGFTVMMALDAALS